MCRLVCLVVILFSFLLLFSFFIINHKVCLSVYFFRFCFGFALMNRWDIQPLYDDDVLQEKQLPGFPPSVATIHWLDNESLFMNDIDFWINYYHHHRIRIIIIIIIVVVYSHIIHFFGYWYQKHNNRCRLMEFKSDILILIVEPNDGHWSIRYNYTYLTYLNLYCLELK